jgi:SOS-response transcriptional repressor LexA
MNANWFKSRQKMLGVTSFDLGSALGRDRTVVSKILNGHQRMSFDQAKIFAEMLNAPVADVLVHAGITDQTTAQTLRPGFSESDAVPWVPKEGVDETADLTISRALGAGKNGIDIWKLQTNSMSLAGYLSGDMVLVDGRSDRSARDGDVVIAQVYDWKIGTANTLLRRFSTPVLVAASADADDAKVYVVDNDRVVIKGTVIASWRLGGLIGTI